MNIVEKFKDELARYANNRYKEGAFETFKNVISSGSVKIYGVNTWDFDNTIAAEAIGLHLEFQKNK